MGDQPFPGSAQPVRHLERVQYEVGAQVGGELPADDHPAVAVEDEGEVDILATADASQALLAHNPPDVVPAALDAPPAQLLPGLAHPVHQAVARAGRVQIDQQPLVVQLRRDGFRDLRA